MQDLDILGLGGEPIGELASSIRARIVDDQDPPAAGQIRAHRGDDRLDVGGFVVGRNHYPDLARRADPGNLDEGLNRPGAPSIQTMPLRNAEIADALLELGVLYELDGANRFRVIAYQEAARVIRQSPVSVEELALAGKATELPGVGNTLQEKIVALSHTGEIPAAVKLKAKFPESLIEVTRIPGLGAKTVRRLYDELGVSSLDELRSAAEGQRIRGLKGLGPKAEENVLASLRSSAKGVPASACCSRTCSRSPRSSLPPCGPTPPPTRSRSPGRPGAARRPARTST